MRIGVTEEGEEKNSGGAVAYVPPVLMVRRCTIPAGCYLPENWTRWSIILCVEFSLSLIVHPLIPLKQNSVTIFSSNSTPQEKKDTGKRKKKKSPTP